jgi:hypothetical protein
MKYLKTWMGVTHGSHLGRDDGYPEKKHKIIDSFEDLIRTYDVEACYFKLEPVDLRMAVKAAQDLGFGEMHERSDPCEPELSNAAKNAFDQSGYVTE